MKRAEMLGPFNINILSNLFRKYKIFLTFDPISIYWNVTIHCKLALSYMHNQSSTKDFIRFMGRQH